MTTHVFPLVTGVETEVRSLSGKEQRLLTEQKSIPFTQRLFSMLASVTVRVGDVLIDSLTDTEKEKVFLDMLSADRKKILIMAQRFTYDFDPTFIFTYKFVNSENGKEDEVTKELDISGGFPEHAMKQFDESVLAGKSFSDLMRLQGDKLDELRESIPDLKFTNYDEVVKNKFIYLSLPKSPFKVKLTLLDGNGERLAGATKKEQRSSHTALLMRQPKRLIESGNTTKEINITVQEMDKMPLPDLECMRKALQIFEPRLDTEFRFERPDGDGSTSEQYIVTDILQQLSFFFPSETI